MNFRFYVFPILLFVLSGYFVLRKRSSTIRAPKPEISFPKLIAHAGGRIAGEKYTNSLQALDNAYKNGFKVIELDFSLTTDKKFVLIHDWERTANKFFGHDGPMGLDQFLAAKMDFSLTQLDLVGLLNWLEQHPDVFIVTDIKEDGTETLVGFLSYIKKNRAHLLNQFIPQIYHVDHWQPVKDLGFERIIYTLYRHRISNQELLEFAISHRLLAVAVNSLRRAKSIATPLYERGVLTFQHTINTKEKLGLALEVGVHGVYTDALTPKDLP